jgi:hypothetical protein
MPKFSGSEVVRHGQISLSQLGNLVETAAAATMPYVNGFAYGSQFGSAIIQAGPDVNITGTFVNSAYLPSSYSNFNQLPLNELVVNGETGLYCTPSNTVLPGIRLALWDATPDRPGAVTTSLQTFKGNKRFGDGIQGLNLSIDNSLFAYQNADGIKHYIYAGDNNGINYQPTHSLIAFSDSVYLTKKTTITNDILGSANSITLDPSDGSISLNKINNVFDIYIPYGPNTLRINGTPTFTGTVPAGKSLTVVNGFITGYQ